MLTQEKKNVNLSSIEKNSSDYLEQRVRDKLGMIKSDEIHIEFQK